MQNLTPSNSGAGRIARCPSTILKSRDVECLYGKELTALPMLKLGLLFYMLVRTVILITHHTHKTLGGTGASQKESGDIGCHHPDSEGTF